MSDPASETPCTEPCPPKPRLEGRPLFGEQEARCLESLFKVLANATRVRLLHALVRCPGACVSDLADTLGMKCQAVSNQLQRLADRGILASRRNGNRIHYRVDDPCVAALLEYGCCLAEDAAGRGRPSTPTSGDLRS